jgi:DNA-binding MarR family transcriptional regulator
MDKEQNSAELVSSFKRLHHVLKQNIFQSLDKDLKPGPFLVMMHLLRENREHEGGVRVSQIAISVGLTVPGVTQIINALEKDGLVTRETDRNDRRAVLIHLNNEGKKLMEPALIRSNDLFAGLIDHLGEDDSQELLRLINKTEEYFSSSIR